MSKSALIDAVAEQTGMTKKEAGAAVDAVATGITAIVKSDDKVTLAGLGTFKPLHRAARTGRNPQTGESIQIAARDTIGFKAAKGV